MINQEPRSSFFFLCRRPCITEGKQDPFPAVQHADCSFLLCNLPRPLITAGPGLHPFTPRAPTTESTSTPTLLPWVGDRGWVAACALEALSSFSAQSSYFLVHPDSRIYPRI